MSPRTPIRRIALVTPYQWGIPHPVNEHVTDLAAAIVEDLGEGAAVIVAPLIHTRARRLTRRALRDLASGVAPDEVIARAELRALAGTGARYVADGAAAVLAIGLPIGPASVAQRASLRVLFEHAQIDVLHVHDPLETDLTRHATRAWHGLTLASFHAVPPAPLLAAVGKTLRERVLDSVDVRIVPDDSMRAPLAGVLGGDADDVVVLEPHSPPTTVGSSARTADAGAHVVVGRGSDDDGQVRALLHALGPLLAEQPELELTLLSRWQQHHRPATPRALRGRLRALRTRTRAEADAVLANAGAYIAFEQTPARAVMEARAHGVPVVRVDDVGELDDALAQLRDALVSGAPRAPQWSRQDLGMHLLRIARELRARRKPALPGPPSSERTCVVDLHMHTNHSWDCATDPEALLFVAKKVGLTAIAVTDHNEISGALACAELADEYGLQVIVGEEVKTSQGEVIGLFLSEKIEQGLSWNETIAEIRRQDGLVYVPHPFDRLHTIPDVHTLRASLDDIDAFEVYNARLAFEQYNRDAERFAHKYNLIEGAGSDAHVVQGLGTAAVHMPAWDDPVSFLAALRQGEIMRRPKSLLYLQGLKLLDSARGRAGTAQRTATS